VIARSVTRRMTLPLLFSVLSLPAIFCWVLLRRGYEPSLRQAVFVYTGAFTVFSVSGRL